jgi:hypothetical protein
MHCRLLHLVRPARSHAERGNEGKGDLTRSHALRGHALCSRSRGVGGAALLLCLLLSGVSGCNLIIPDVSHEPLVHNPFPQLSRVAVAPFFNQSDEATVDGRDFAMAYYAELQAVPGFEVVPLGVVEEAILENQIRLSSPGEARRLAKVLGVDAVVIGAVTDYTPYYPPRCGLRVEWYAANPGFHEIPPGYGLPWGTPEEEYIPAPLVFEAEMALARAQLATQTPDCEAGACTQAPSSSAPGQPGNDNDGDESPLPAPADQSDAGAKSAVVAAAYEQQTSGPCEGSAPLQSELAAVDATTGAIVASGALPPDWPDERGFIPPGPSPVRPPCVASDSPIITHTRIYHGNDGEFTEALASYVYFRDDARFGGWQTYLQRSDDFIRFCCHMHISEMLSARGGAGQTRVVWQWSESR